MNVLTQYVASKKGEKTPFMIEIPVAAELEGPFLVSAAGKKRDLMWVENKFPNSSIRAGVRKAATAFLFRQALEHVSEMSQECGWGSVHPDTAEGLSSALQHLQDYDLDEVIVLYGDGYDKSHIPEDVPCHKELWVPKGWAVVVPRDRSYVGTTVVFDGGWVGMVVHNAARGIGFSIPESSGNSAEAGESGEGMAGGDD